VRIAQVAPLMESVPPSRYGGTERIVSWLCEELVAQGHDVTLFASGDSITSANLIPCASEALRLNPGVRDWIPHYMVMLDRVRRMVQDFDILHFHIDAVHFPVFHASAARALTTLHGRQDIADLQTLYRGFPDMGLVSISDSQRTPVPNANFVATIPHGLPEHLHRPNYAPRGGYLAFLGRISPEKRPDIAIAIARATGLPLKIAAKVDRVDEDYWREVVEPLTHQADIEFIGEIDERQKSAFLGDALGLLFPIDWPEPFGIVMIEAMACGTPVLAFDCGSVREIIRDGVTGRIVSTIDEAVAAVPSLLRLDRRRIRQAFEAEFTAARMASDYARLYRHMVERVRAPRTADTLEKDVTVSRPPRSVLAN
jgi:glycosyltransferase involved in cell wall biosynthesis